mmetsp:Transcript_50150/g.57576  ORF Transcript_50150/g.57576 Transcript_50150/m.57576 type:complete len:86 (+) Transcript_50150:126-383(+)
MPHIICINPGKFRQMTEDLLQRTHTGRILQKEKKKGERLQFFITINSLKHTNILMIKLAEETNSTSNPMIGICRRRQIQEQHKVG